MSEAGHQVQPRSAKCEYRISIFVFKTIFHLLREILIPLKKKVQTTKLVTLINLRKWFTSLSTLLRLQFVKTTYLEKEWNNDYIGIGNLELVKQCREQLTQIEIIMFLTKASIVSSLWKKNSSLWFTTPGLFWRFRGK